MEEEDAVLVCVALIPTVHYTQLTHAMNAEEIRMNKVAFCLRAVFTEDLILETSFVYNALRTRRRKSVSVKIVKRWRQERKGKKF